MKFTVTTYNILADAYMRRSYYPSSSESDLASESRRQLLLETIRKLDSDVFCLQEVEPAAFADIDRALEGHAGFLAQKTGKPEGCALFVRKELASAEFSELRFKNVSDKKNQLAALARIQLGSSSVGISSTHLQWMKNSTASADHLGRLQLEELIEHAGDSIPWIHCGDFNANSQSCVIEAAEKKGFVQSCRSQRPWDSTNINGKRRKIDYLIYPEGKLSVRPLPLPKLARDTPMPSATHASDHLPVTVEFEVSA